MLTVFEIVFHPGSDPETLLSDEMKRETLAQIMTPEEAEALGFRGLQPDPKGRTVRLVAVAQRDARWMERVCESSDLVAGYRAHEVGG